MRGQVSGLIRVSIINSGGGPLGSGGLLGVLWHPGNRLDPPPTYAQKLRTMRSWLTDVAGAIWFLRSLPQEIAPLHRAHARAPERRLRWAPSVTDDSAPRRDARSEPARACWVRARMAVQMATAHAVRSRIAALMYDDGRCSVDRVLRLGRLAGEASPLMAW